MNNNDYPSDTKQLETFPPPPYKETDNSNSSEVPKQRNINANPYGQSPQPSNTQTIPQGEPIQVVSAGMSSTKITSETPMSCTCPKCQQAITTRIEKHNGLLVWLIVLILLVFGLWLGCCLIPFCIDDLKDTDHFCPNCAHFIGRRKKI